MACAKPSPAQTRAGRSSHGPPRPGADRDAGQRKRRRATMIFGMGFGGLFVLILLLVAVSFRVLREYERGVVFMLGRFWKVKGPGLILIIPILQQWVRVELRTIVMDVPPQDVITRDNVSVKVNAVVYFRVVDLYRNVIASNHVLRRH